jgi:5-(carboxyamino)imidazole ribonucleotide synthase
MISKFPGIVLGILGGGQLGRMTAQAAPDFNLTLRVLDPDPSAPARFLCHEFVQGDFSDFQTVLDFGRSCDIVTIEIEHVNVKALQLLKNEGVRICPDPDIIQLIQDKGLQKKFYFDHGIPTAPFYLLDDPSLHDFSYPVVQKLCSGGYDGKGVAVLKSEKDTPLNGRSVIEHMVEIDKEIAAIVSRNTAGEKSIFPLVEMEFNDEANLVEYLFCPSSLSEEQQLQCQNIAYRIVDALDYTGLLAVEMFVDVQGQILVNEMAPRPHNSGHHTIEACATSQFQQFIRMVLDLPPGDTSLVRPAVMINLLGEQGSEGVAVYEGFDDALATSSVYLHLYGKKNTKPFRKMGHITVVDASLDIAKEKALQIKKKVRIHA